MSGQLQHLIDQPLNAPRRISDAIGKHVSRRGHQLAVAIDDHIAHGAFVVRRTHGRHCRRGVCILANGALHAGTKQLRRICNGLRPRSRMQERVFGPIGFLNSYGPQLADELITAADPFRIEHGVLEL